MSVRGSSVLLIGLDAVGAGDAWAGGMTLTANGAHQRPLIEHWNGRAWRAVALPAKDAAWVDSGSQPFGFIGASAGRNVWAFAAGGRYLRLRGTRWTAGRLPKPSTGRLFVDSVRVFGPADAWVFGARVSGSVSGGLRFAPYAARFDGRRWRVVPVPGKGILGTVSAVSARDMWAVAGTRLAGAGPGPVPRVLRWNGLAWRAARVQPALLGRAVLSSILARSASDVWVGGGVPDGRKGGTSELAERWNGKSWIVASPPAAPSAGQFSLTDLAPDGRNGLWALAFDSASGTQRLRRYAGGTWSAPASLPWTLLRMAAVPGTGSAWAIGVRGNSGVILVAGAIPR